MSVTRAGVVVVGENRAGEPHPRSVDLVDPSVDVVDPPSLAARKRKVGEMIGERVENSKPLVV